MDGIFLHKIELLGDLRPPILHLTMNDNASNPTVLDSAASQRHQTFIDPGGNPNTNTHSVPGPNGTTALAFDGVDDRIDFGPTLLSEMVGAGRDFSLAFWYKTDSSPAAKNSNTASLRSIKPVTANRPIQQWSCCKIMNTGAQKIRSAQPVFF